MRILHYYWTQYNDMEKPGGGIRVYVNNIINVQSKNNDVYMLNSGIDYDLSGKCYIKEIKNTTKKQEVKQFSIYNSPMLAPSKCSFYNQRTFLNDKILASVLEKFLSENGPFDVIHFHSLEGLSLNVMTLKSKFPDTKFILTLHNYYIFCPQVNLWQNDNCSCDNYNDGENCVSCIKHLPNTRLVKYSYILSSYLRNFGLEEYSEKITKNLKQLYSKFRENKAVSEENHINVDFKDYRKFRETNIKYLNQYFDTIICVSKRVRNIAIGFGILAEKCKVIYIGTTFADNQAFRCRYPIKDNVLRILYMGYMRKDKGFYFFVDALNNMPKDIAEKIEVIIAARFDDLEMVSKCKILKSKFKNIKLYNGYTHKEIPIITENVNLGIVPVLWEDNLPQVSMEMKSMGIPVLSSDRGGASELSESQFFKFKSGDIASFIKTVDNILKNHKILDLYYKKGLTLITNQEHCEILKKVYSK